MPAAQDAGERSACAQREREVNGESGPGLPLAIPVFVRSRDAKGKEFLEFATALNVSAGGMLVAMRRALPAIAQIRLEIPSAPVAALALLPQSLADSAGQGPAHYAGRRLLSAGPEVLASAAASSSRTVRRRKIASAV